MLLCKHEKYDIWLSVGRHIVLDENPISEHERAKTRWATKEELKEMNLFPNILFYAEEALKELGEK